jgi:nucleotide-binding universal stress UspA family protein
MKILMCHDGSKEMEKAIRFAGGIAKACDADVILLGIVEPGSDDSAMQAHWQRARALLEDDHIRTELVSKPGPPVMEIIEHTESSDYDLVIIGAGLAGVAMPAKAYELAQRIEAPVLLFTGDRTTLQKILICSGGKNYIEKAISGAGKIARGTGAGVTLLHVAAELPLIYADLISREKDVEALLDSTSELGRNLRQQKGMLEKMGVTVEVSLRHGLVIDQVIAEANQGDYDLIVVGSPVARGPLFSYVLGDVTREIVNRACCPVLIARETLPSNAGGFWRRLFGSET